MNYLITGEQGSGKTTKAKEIIGDSYFSNLEKNWSAISVYQIINGIYITKDSEYILIEEITSESIKNKSFIFFINQVVLKCSSEAYSKVPDIILTSNEDLDLSDIWFKEFEHIKLEKEKKKCFLEALIGAGVKIGKSLMSYHINRIEFDNTLEKEDFEHAQRAWGICWELANCDHAENYQECKDAAKELISEIPKTSEWREFEPKKVK